MRFDPAPIRPHRTRTAFAALLALLVAAFAALPAALAQGDDPVVFEVDGEPGTLSHFEHRFEIAIRSAAAQQGVEVTDEVRAEYAPFAETFLAQLAEEAALLQEADARDLHVSEAEVDAIIAELRGEGDAAAFDDLLTTSGIGDESALRALIEEGERIGLLQQEVAADIEVSDEEVREAFDAAQTEDLEFEEVRDQVHAQLVQQRVQEELNAVIEAAEVTLYPENLPFDTSEN